MKHSSKDQEPEQKVPCQWLWHDAGPLYTKKRSAQALRSTFLMGKPKSAHICANGSVQKTADFYD